MNSFKNLLVKIMQSSINTTLTMLCIVLLSLSGCSSTRHVTSHINPQIEVVVARYNEGISWIAKNFPTQKVTLYNKGKDDIKVGANVEVIKLPNIGRESHTYLYHIVNNYDNLKTVVVFLQGNPFDHGGQDLINKLKVKDRKMMSLFSRLDCSLVAAGPFTSNLKGFALDEENLRSALKDTPRWSDTDFNPQYSNIEEYAKKLNFFESEEKKFCGTWGAQFGVLSETIRRRDVEFYRSLLDTVSHSKSPIEGHYLERLWGLIFAPKNRVQVSQ